MALTDSETSAAKVVSDSESLQSLPDEFIQKESVLGFYSKIEKNLQMLLPILSLFRTPKTAKTFPLHLLF